MHYWTSSSRWIASTCWHFIFNPKR